MKKFLPDLIAILAFIILSFAYFFPADIEPILRLYRNHQYPYPQDVYKHLHNSTP